MISVAAAVTTMVCRGCGYTALPQDAEPFRCPNSGRDDADHVLECRSDLDEAEVARVFRDTEPDPFVRYRKLTHTWHTAMESGLRDSDYIAWVHRLEERIAAIDGATFRVTPFYEQHLLGHTLDLHADLWVKNETNNVAQSHKGRHLMGLAIWLAVAERLDPKIAHRRLAIASCGNAALAAAVIAAAAGRALDVFIPDSANDRIVTKLERLGAHVRRCRRRAGEVGDPAYLRFREAVAAGALPFSVQGNENGMAIEGAQTLGWEMVSQLLTNRAEIDRLFIQVGGGALASACIAAFELAHRAGVIRSMPRIHAVQTEASPLLRAWTRLGDRGADYAVTHRSELMWPWPDAPESVATGILDDETYDWSAVVRGMKESGGWPLAVAEERIIEAHRLGVYGSGIAATPTGTAGLAGLIELQRQGEIAPNDSLAVIFTG